MRANQVKETYGPGLSLEHLRSLSTDEIKTELLKLKGLGPKSVSCILAFTLDRDELAVDTHVYRLCKRLGWAPDHLTREQLYDYVNSVVENPYKRALHVLLIKHGQRHCQARSYDCKSCVLKNHCATGQSELW